MISAAIAYDIAKSFDGDLKRVEREIRRRAEEGETNCVVSCQKEWFTDFKKELEDLGFKVWSCGDFRSETLAYYNVDWNRK